MWFDFDFKIINIIMMILPISGYISKVSGKQNVDSNILT